MMELSKEQCADVEDLMIAAIYARKSTEQTGVADTRGEEKAAPDDL